MGNGGGGGGGPLITRSPKCCVVKLENKLKVEEDHECSFLTADLDWLEVGVDVPARKGSCNLCRTSLN